MLMRMQQVQMRQQQAVQPQQLWNQIQMFPGWKDVRRRCGMDAMYVFKLYVYLFNVSM
jgi:hypothetical protein